MRRTPDPIDALVRVLTRGADRLLAAGSGGRLGADPEVRAADAARDRGDWGGAVVAYRAAIAIAPRRAGVWVQLGHALKEAGDTPAAIDCYDRAIALAPHRADPRRHLAHALLRLDRLNAARDAFARLLVLAPRDDAAHAAVAHIDQAMRIVETEAAMAARLAAATGQEQAGDLSGAAATLLAASRAEPQREGVAARYRAVRGALNAASRRHFDAADPVRARGVPRSLRMIAFGTTGTCNASCLHCPTGKASTAHVPRTTMPLPLFRGIVTQLAALDLEVRDQISLGLFGDGLVDPHVVERAVILREHLPAPWISVNTNGAAYSREKHRGLFDLTSIVALHAESLIPEVYDRLMQPLRLERVQPKMEQILADFPRKVHVSVPVSRLNRAELPAIDAWFRSRGAMTVAFDGLSSRCAEDQSAYARLALNPVPIRCGPDALDDLIVDCDGMVLICCQDFQRIEPIGNLAETPLADVLTALERRRVREQFSTGRHAERQTCSRCFGDPRMDPAEALRVPAAALG